jgi:hypothetical protein
MSKVKVDVYIECPRCNKNNFDTPEFWGCPRGSCEVKVKGEIVSTLEINKNG